MDLILWRHAEAVEGQPGEDLARKLTSKGERQAERMAEWLNRRLAHSTKILVSPAVRCQETAKALGRKFRTVDELAPGASAQEVLDVAKWPEASNAVLIVGHQPTLGETAALLLSGSDAPWGMRKAAVWWLSNRSREQGADVVLKAVIGPDFL